jgi:hypothetical protein
MLFHQLREHALHAIKQHSLRVVECGMGAMFTYTKITDGSLEATGICLTPRAEGANGGLQSNTLEDILTQGLQYDYGKRAFALATINAISQYLLIRDKPVLTQDLRGTLTQFVLNNTKKDSKIMFIGDLQPVVHTLKQERDNVSVFCRQHTDVQNGVYNDIYEYEAISQADILIITGAALIGSTIDALLHFANKVPIKVLTGFSAGTYPAWFKGSGLTHIGSMYLEDIRHSTLLHHNLNEIFTYPCYISEV